MVSFVACLGSPRKERLSCIASLSRSQSPFCCCVPQESSRGSASDPSKSVSPTPPPNHTDHLLRSEPLQSPRPSKIFIPQVQPTAPARKSSGGAPCLVQEDIFFYCDSHPFNNRKNAEPHAECDLRNFLRNATAKTRATSPHLLRCVVVPLCLVSGTLSRNRQRSFRLF